MSKRNVTILVAALFCSLMLVMCLSEGLTGIVLANGTSAIDWCVIGGGGVHDLLAPYSLDSTISQPVAGAVTDTGYELCSGFWCGATMEHRLYHPLVTRNY